MFSRCEIRSRFCSEAWWVGGPGQDNVTAWGGGGQNHSGRRSALFFADPGVANFLFAAYTPLKVTLGWHSVAAAPTLCTMLPSHTAMAPHLTLAEQDAIFASRASGKTAATIFELMG